MDLNWVNAFICGFGAVACLCRLGKLEDANEGILRNYEMWFVVMLASAISPIWTDVSLMQFILGAAFSAQIVLSFWSWGKKSTEYAMR